jgi:hypothetical protein
MDKAYEAAISLGAISLWLDASLTAVPFYEAIKWEYVEMTMHGTLKCVRMTKNLLTKVGPR